MSVAIDFFSMTSNTSVLTIKKGEILLLSCQNTPKKPSSFQEIQNKTQLTVTCDHEDIFLVEGMPYKFAELQCDNAILPILRKFAINCLAENTEIISVGFNEDDTVYEGCYDNTHNIPLYATSIISGLNRADDVLESKWYEEEDLPKSGFDGAYSCSEKTSCCYEKQPLVNPSYIAYGPAQRATFISQLNAVPIRIPCNETLEKVGETFIIIYIYMYKY